MPRTVKPPPTVPFSADFLRSLPESERAALIATLDARELQALQYEWDFWARPVTFDPRPTRECPRGHYTGQLPPPGDWSVWVFQGGRGTGKTRTGAELVRSMIERDGMGRVYMIGATAADVRDTMVEGESGILSVCPPWNRPKFEPSKRRVRWPNGAVAMLFSADEPERLRGPQGAGGWADEVGCLVAGTPVETETGPVPIEEVRPGMRVHTRTGLRAVTDAWMTHPAAEIYRLEDSAGNVLEGTGNHPVYVVGKGFTSLSSLCYGDTITTWNINSSRASSGAENAGGSTAVTTATARADCSTGPSTRPLTGRSSPASKSTTSTKTRRTTTRRTSRLSPRPNTAASTRGALRSGLGIATSPTATHSGRNESRTRSGVPNAAGLTPQPVRGPSSAPRNAEGNPPSGSRQPGACGLTRGRASTAGPCSNQPSGRPDSALSDATTSTSRGCPFSRPSPCGNAAAAEPISSNSARERCAAPRRAGTSCVVSVQRLATRRPVYDLTVADGHEFYASNILVHNSWRRASEAYDNLMFGLRLGRWPRLGITTTNKAKGEASKLLRSIKQAVNTVVTKGTTYDNRDNLAPSFFSQVITKYEGSRLGKQELLGEDLDDAPGALWTTALLDETRVARVPPGVDLIRIVVGLDPAGNIGDMARFAAGLPLQSDNDGDDAGIWTAGLGSDGHLYFLADDTTSGSPAEWGRAAVVAFRRHHADRVVGEGNHGGDNVEGVVRAVDPNIPFEKVHASRGKAIRAEPVAARFEQGKAHMVGEWPATEDELVNWEPGMASPNRLDALVIAASALCGDTGSVEVEPDPYAGHRW